MVLENSPREGYQSKSPMPHERAVWRRLCRAMRSRTSPALYRTCFVGTTAVSLNDGTLTIAAPTTTARDVLRHRFAPVLEEVAVELVRRRLGIRFITASEVGGAAGRLERTAAGGLPAQHRPDFSTPTALNPRYTFDSFICVESNRLAFTAAKQVVTAPGASYNPLFLYGNVGLGKTHLLVAIGHQALNQGLRAAFLTAEHFASEMVRAIQLHAMDAFRAAYQALDILLVDDIQFISGRESTEEAFFHIFNELHMAGKQIVLTSDRPPRAIPILHERLRTRFEWGLMADIHAPDYAHRLAILTAKAATAPFTIPPSVLEYIARPDGMNIRTLEGALHRIISTATCLGTKPTISLAASTLRDFLGDAYRVEIDPVVVVELVARHFHLEVEGLTGKGRNRALTWPRQVAMYVLREETPASLAQIGAALGGRDHTTIMHGCEQVVEALRHDDAVRHEIAQIRVAVRTAMTS